MATELTPDFLASQRDESLTTIKRVTTWLLTGGGDLWALHQPDERGNSQYDMWVSWEAAGTNLTIEEDGRPSEVGKRVVRKTTYHQGNNRPQFGPSLGNGVVERRNPQFTVLDGSSEIGTVPVTRNPQGVEIVDALELSRSSDGILYDLALSLGEISAHYAEAQPR